MVRDSSRTYKKAFTLIEVLIATTIFAFVMVMTTGVIAQSTGYQSKIAAVRESSQEAARISDAIARDIRMASADPFTVVDFDNRSTEFKNGVVLLDNNGRFDVNYLTGLAGITGSAYSMKTLIISSKDSIRFYIYDSTQMAVYAKSFSKKIDLLDPTNATFRAIWWAESINTLKINGIAGSNNIITYIKNDITNKISSDNQEIKDFGFAGFTASSVPSSPNQQSYVIYIVNARTKNFDSMLPSQRAATYLRTMVTVRNYAL